jgi:hypothetical protein
MRDYVGPAHLGYCFGAILGLSININQDAHAFQSFDAIWASFWSLLEPSWCFLGGSLQHVGPWQALGGLGVLGVPGGLGRLTLLRGCASRVRAPSRG